METKAKENTTKERRGVSPSTIRSSSRSPRNSLTSDHKITTSLSPSDKRLPNYLRPTASSRHEPSKLSSKKNMNAAEDPTQKSVLLRRRSFDKPPSTTSRVLKDGAMTTRSSSFSPKISVLPKPKLDRSLTRTSISAKSPMLSPGKNIKKNVISTGVKKESSSSGKVSNDIDVIEIKEEEKEAIVDDVIDAVGKLESEVEIPFEIPKSENKSNKDDDDDVLEIDNIEDGEIDLCDISTVSDDLNATQALLDEEFEKILHVQQTENHIVEDEQRMEETTVEVIKDEETPDSDVGQSNPISTEECGGDEKKKDEKELVHEEKQVVEVGEVEEEVKPEVTVVAKRVAGGGNKKESPVYNDVIEETAGKLLEKRKNKVKALVGAFETVISLQEPD